MRMLVIPVTPFQQNCSIVWDEDSGRAAVVDPGGDVHRVLKAVEQEGLQLEKVLLTHAHLDHAAAAPTLAGSLGIPIEGPHREDRYWIDNLPELARRYGFPAAPVFEPDRWLEQGDTVSIGAQQLQVRHCPGHTPGHVVFFDPQQRFAWVGDVLFAGSIGRSDLPGGSHETLLRSIRENLFPLGDDVRFLPGHGPMSTFGEQRQSNPFVADRLFR